MAYNWYTEKEREEIGILPSFTDYWIEHIIRTWKEYQLKLRKSRNSDLEQARAVALERRKLAKKQIHSD